jgi:hypothetical protein
MTAGRSERDPIEAATPIEESEVGPRGRLYLMDESRGGRKERARRPHSNEDPIAISGHERVVDEERGESGESWRMKKSIVVDQQPSRPVGRLPSPAVHWSAHRQPSAIGVCRIIIGVSGGVSPSLVRGIVIEEVAVAIFIDHPIADGD